MSQTNSSNDSDNSICTNSAYDQWQQWAQKNRRIRRPQESENLIFGDDTCDRKIHQHMDLPHKRRVSLLEGDINDDTSDDCDQLIAPWKMLATRRSLIEKEEGDNESSIQWNTPLNNADVIFLPPTCLRRSDEHAGHSLSLISMRFLKTIENNEKSLNSSFTEQPYLGNSKNFSFDSVDSLSAAPLPIIAALASRPPYNFSRDSCQPLAC